MVNSTRPLFSGPAQHIWAQMSPLQQQQVLDNVWCAACRKATTMVQYSGQVQAGDLLLRGFCSTCGHEVSRLLESE